MNRRLLRVRVRVTVLEFCLEICCYTSCRAQRAHSATHAVCLSPPPATRLVLSLSRQLAPPAGHGSRPHRPLHVRQSTTSIAGPPRHAHACRGTTSIHTPPPTRLTKPRESTAATHSSDCICHHHHILLAARRAAAANYRAAAAISHRALSRAAARLVLRQRPCHHRLPTVASVGVGLSATSHAFSRPHLRR